MGVLAALAGQWKFGLYGLLAAGLLIGGWTANGWRLEAAQARGLRAALQSEMKARVEADAARVALGLQLSEAEAAIGQGIKTVTKRIKVYVPADSRCDIPDTFRGMLDRARAGLPPATDPASASPAEP